jgi:hypothetical protein
MDLDQEKIDRARISKELDECDKIIEVLQTDGWKLIEKEFRSYIEGLNTIRGLDIDRQDIKAHIGARNMAIGILETLLQKILNTQNYREFLLKQLEIMNRKSSFYEIKENSEKD